MGLGRVRRAVAGSFTFRSCTPHSSTTATRRCRRDRPDGLGLGAPALGAERASPGRVRARRGRDDRPAVRGPRHGRSGAGQAAARRRRPDRPPGGDRLGDAADGRRKLDVLRRRPGPAAPPRGAGRLAFLRPDRRRRPLDRRRAGLPGDRCGARAGVGRGNDPRTRRQPRGRAGHSRRRLGRCGCRSPLARAHPLRALLVAGRDAPAQRSCGGGHHMGGVALFQRAPPRFRLAVPDLHGRGGRAGRALGGTDAGDPRHPGGPRSRLLGRLRPGARRLRERSPRARHRTFERDHGGRRRLPAGRADPRGGRGRRAVCGSAGPGG